MIGRILFSLLLGGFFLGVYAQNLRSPYFEHVTIREGLKSEHVNDICQDKTGFIWIATDNGVNKYDGLNMEGYAQKVGDSTSLNHRKVISIACDANNNVWVSTLKGLFRYNREKDNFQQYFVNEGKTSWKCDYLFADSKGYLWIVKNKRLLYSNELKPNDKDSYREFKIETSEGEKKPLGDVRDMIEIDEDEYLCRDKKNIYVLNLKSKTGYVVEKKGIRGNIGALSQISGKKLSVVTYFGHYIGVIRNKKLVVEQKYTRSGKPEFAPGTITSAVADDEGRVWIGTTQGGYVFVPHRGTYTFSFFTHDFNREHSISGNNISKIFKDEGNVVWIGTKGYGIEKFDEHKIKFEKYNIINKKDKNGSYYNIEAVHKDSYGLVWIDTYWTLYALNEQTGEYQRVGETEIMRNPSGMFERAPGEMWVYGAYLQRVIYELDEEGTVIIKQVDTYKDALFGLDKVMVNFADADFDQEGNLWLGSKKSGLIKMQLPDDPAELPVVSGIYKKTGKIKPNIGAMSDIEFDKEGNLWLATFWDGIYKFDTKKLKFVEVYKRDAEKEHTLLDQGARSLYADTIGSMWAATQDGGLNHIYYKADSVVSYSEEDGFLSRTMSSIQEDNEGNLWIGTGGGISRFSKKNKTVVNFGVDDGLQGYYFSTNSSFKDEDGFMYFGGNKGLNVFDPNVINKANDYKPRVALKELIVNKERVLPNDKTKILNTTFETTEHIKIKYKHNDFQIRFAALSFSTPEKNMYKYKLEGYDEDWVEVSAQSPWATYSNLPRGKYKFMVKASNSSLIWSDQVTTLDIRVRPAWWSTYIFYIIWIVVISGIVYTMVKVREERLKKDREKLQRELDSGKEEIEQQRVRVENQQEELRLRDEREKIAKWHNNGIIKISDVISENRDNEGELSGRVINSIVEYIEVQQGAIYLYFDSNEDPYLELRGGFALNEDRLKSTKVFIGEGLIGTCFRKSEIIRTDNLPGTYSRLESGLGEVSMKYSVLFPIRYEETVVGVIEILSLDKLEEYKVQFIEAVIRSLASALININSNLKIQNMLSETKSQQEMLTAHEEELRQNLEELAATQEESARREENLEKKIVEYEIKIKELTRQR